MTHAFIPNRCYFKSLRCERVDCLPMPGETVRTVKSNMKELARENTDPKQSNKPAERWSGCLKWPKFFFVCVLIRCCLRTVIWNKALLDKRYVQADQGRDINVLRLSMRTADHRETLLHLATSSSRGNHA